MKGPLRLPEAVKQGVRQLQGFQLQAVRREAVPAPEPHAPQGHRGAMPLPPQSQEKLHGPGGHGGGHIGLEAQVTDAEIGLQRQLGQLPG